MKFSSAEIKNMALSLQEAIFVHGEQDEQVLQTMYSELFENYPALFNMVVKLTKQEQFEDLHTNLAMMLNMLERLEKGKISREDADVKIGKHIADKYLPKFKKEAP
jgi:hemoglobin-like flavoprotein